MMPANGEIRFHLVLNAFEQFIHAVEVLTPRVIPSCGANCLKLAFSVLSVEYLNLAPTVEVYGLAYVLATRQGGGIGRRARLRIPKSAISNRYFPFQKTIDLRWQNAVFRDQHAFTTGE
jgi:hypothetical protein